MRPKKRTAESDAMCRDEAKRRARKLPPAQRVSSKSIAEHTGLAVGTVEQVISHMRREIEANVRVEVSRESSTPIVNSQSSEAK